MFQQEATQRKQGDKKIRKNSLKGKKTVIVTTCFE
jgi:hypothetical protein